MKVFEYKTEQLINADMQMAWEFFYSPKNLALITPPSLSFKILSKLNDIEIYQGMHINYIVKPLFGIPLKWKTEIGETDKPDHFIDKQIKGPFKFWEHKHTFIEKENGVLMTDELKYELPFGLLGNIAHELIVKKKIEYIFTYRKEVLQKIFN